MTVEAQGIRHHLLAWAAPQPIWIGRTAWTAQGLRAALARDPDTCAPLHNCGVALCLSSAEQTAIAMGIVDGMATHAVLVPPDTPEAHLEAFCRQAGVSCIVRESDSTSAGSIASVLLDDLIGSEGADIALPQNDTRWIISTSGTTGVPKLVEHTFESLTRTVRRGAKQTAQRWALIYGLTRFAGLQVFLQALASGATLVFTEHLTSMSDRVRWMVEQQCDAISATPTMWRQILMAVGSDLLKLRRVTLGGEIVDEGILKALAQCYPDARIVHIYASTEAGVGFAVRDGRAGFPASFLEEIQGGVGLRVGEDGVLRIRPPSPPQRYVGGDAISDEGGWINTGDMVDVRQDRIYFRGRASGAFSVGGEAVYPEEIEAVILQLPEVSASRVTGRRSSLVGHLVEASVVPRNSDADRMTLIKTIKAHCAAQLPRQKVPAVIKVLSELPAESSGKMSRKELPQ